nr:MAG TPA: hypothetical protein [Bacteriophage sp.]
MRTYKTIFIFRSSLFTNYWTSKYYLGYDSYSKF